jgi:tetratricopeptide repeat protein/pentacotripeptide repeat protein
MRRPSPPLNMYLGKESEAVRLLSDSALINKAEGTTLSEFRDRMYIAVAYQARAMRREFAAEMNRVAALERDMKLSPEWLYLLGRLYARSGKPTEAQRLLQKMPSRLNEPVVVSGINRNDRASHSAFRGLQGEVAAANGKVADAVELFEQAFSIYDDALNLEALAYGYMKQGKLDVAIEKYELFLKHPIVFGHEAQEYWLNAHLQLGKIYEQKNEPQKAKEWYERLLSIWKDADPDVVAFVEAKSRLSTLPK